MLNVFEARLLANIGTVSVADVISAEADEVNKYRARFAPIIAGTIKDYDGKVEWDKAKVMPVELTLDQKKYFAFGVDDVEELLTNPKRIEREARKQARDISETEDKFLFEKLASGAGKSISRTITKPEQAYEAIVDANKELSKLNAPLEDRFVIVDYDTLGLLEKDARFNRYDEILANGIVQGARVNGANVIVTNALPKDTILAVQREGVAFARFIDKIESMRLESAFADGIRGLSVYDGSALEKDYIVKVSTASATK